jgi:hypothetical protein
MSKLTLFRSNCIRRFAQIFSLATIGFVFQACYGIPMKDPDFFNICIRLQDGDGNLLKDMDIIINDSIYSKTDENGMSYTDLSLDYSLYKIHITGNDIYQPLDTVVTNEKYSVWMELKLEKK